MSAAGHRLLLKQWKDSRGNFLSGDIVTPGIKMNRVIAGTVVQVTIFVKCSLQVNKRDLFLFCRSYNLILIRLMKFMEMREPAREVNTKVGYRWDHENGLRVVGFRGGNNTPQIGQKLTIGHPPFSLGLIKRHYRLHFG